MEQEVIQELAVSTSECTQHSGVFRFGMRCGMVRLGTFEKVAHIVK